MVLAMFFFALGFLVLGYSTGRIHESFKNKTL
jgi:hypothetical protein